MTTPLETVWLETRNNTSATSTTVLTTGHAYRIRIEGNYDPYDGGGPSQWTVIYPSTSASSGGQRDAEVWESGTHYDWFKIDLGSGPSHREPVGGPFSVAQPGHVYWYEVVGEGAAATFHHGDDILNDNNGRFKIEIHKALGPTVGYIGPGLRPA